MTREKTVSFQSFYNLKWDLGLPDDFDRNLIRKYPDCFRVVKGSNGLACLKLLKWDDEFVVSALQRGKENVDLRVFGNGETELRKFKRGKNGLAFTMSFSRGYGAQKKVKAWMDEFQKLPYISPYEEYKKLKKRYVKR
ncbi:hypothetical protein POM88_011737 [Heracleum sosnowskyi]|uniref:PORR domain-containing protein n=1 Tax=Heracleum sosnowskyi TaxID=360622 RepID=A0AAD8IXL6_9APIA|nr:hypothetical protein POM88_011737 [Heracleum sosnowskyi]